MHLNLWVFSLCWFEVWVLGIMLSSKVPSLMDYPIHLAEKGPLPIHGGVIHFLCVAGVILRENECLIVGKKISRASFTARRHVVGAGQAK